MLCQVCVAKCTDEATSLILVRRFVDQFKDLGEADTLVHDHNTKYNPNGISAEDPVSSSPTNHIVDDIKTLDDLTGKTTCLVTLCCFPSVIHCMVCRRG